MAAGDDSRAETLVRLLNERPTDRRTFLVRAAALGVSASAAGSLLAACGGDSGDAVDTAGEDAPPATRGGSVQVGMTDFFSTDTIDPAQPISGFALMHGANVFETLTDVDEQFNPVPRLAESWESSDGATVWVFNLRQGVEFHDGKPLTAADVVYTYQRQFVKETAASFVPLIDGVVDPKKVVALDNGRVQFTLQRPHAYFPELVAVASFAIVQDGATDFTKPAGTGPYKVVEYKQGERVEWARNENYWITEKPYLDSIRILQFQDPATKVQSVISGDLDIADPVEFTALPTVDQADSVKRVALKDALFVPTSCDQTQEPFTDLKVRQAFKHAIDRERYINAVFAGAATATADIPVPRSDPFYPTDMAPLEYDPERAKALLSEAGYPDGIDIKCYTAPTAPGEVDAAVAFKDIMAESGIRVEPVVQSPDQFFVEAFLVKPFVVGALLRQHASVIAPLVYTTNATFPQSQFGNADFDELISQAIASEDLETSKGYFADAWHLMNEECGELIPAHHDRIWITKNSVEGLKIDFTQMVDWREAYVT
jgi:peptide/nickel transport system substrate-binding protein